MLIDYLRYVAYKGRLRSFFQEGIYSFVDPSVTTGQHLRFSENEYFDRRWSRYVYDPTWEFRQDFVDRLRFEFGAYFGSDYFPGTDFENDRAPWTSSFRGEHSDYFGRRFPSVEIIVDIDPVHWSERYSERRAYEDVPIVYRRAGPLKGNAESGYRLLSGKQGERKSGTLCGVFRSPLNKYFALTCGHVISNSSAIVSLEKKRSFWKFPLPPSVSPLGETRHVASPSAVIPGGPIHTKLDAALVELDETLEQFMSRREISPATFRPISSFIQGEPVWFRGAGRNYDTLAQVSAVTVKKSIDLFDDGNLQEVGDVLMLGHRNTIYVSQPVSRPGDSGSAVRQARPIGGSNFGTNEWFGMILGSDQCGAYATFAEHLWGWAAHQLGNHNIEFTFEV